LPWTRLLQLSHEDGKLFDTDQDRLTVQRVPDLAGIPAPSATAGVYRYRSTVIAPVELLGSIKVGSTAEVRPSGPMGGSYQAKVKIVDRLVDAASDTSGVRLEIPNPENRLVAGIRCKVISHDR
jgi:multidrug efflux pump subunit AcrA (membrane-fusion protein)